MAKKNYLKKLTVSDGKGGTEDIVVLTPEALTDVVRVTKSRIESIDDAVAALNDKVIEAVNGDVIYVAQPDTPEQLAEDGTIFYVDCADLGDGLNVVQMQKQENPYVKDLCGNYESNGSVSIYPDSFSAELDLVGSSITLPADMIVFFGAAGNGNFHMSDSAGNTFRVLLGDGNLAIEGVFNGMGAYNPFSYATTVPKGFHHYALVFSWFGLTNCEAAAVKVYVDGEPLTDTFDELLRSTDEEAGFVVDGFVLDTKEIALFNLTYIKVVSSNYWGTPNHNTGNPLSTMTYDDTVVIEYQKKKMAHSDYTKYLTTTEALKKLIGSLNYDLEVGGSLDVTLGGLAWVNGETLLSQANTAGTTLSNVTLRNVTIENSDIADSTISESEITSVEMSESTLDGTNEIYHVIGSPEKVKEWLKESDLTWDDEEKTEQTEENVSVATAAAKNLSKDVDTLKKTTLKGELLDNGDGSSTLVFDAGTYGSMANSNTIDGGEIQSDGSVVDAGEF